MKKNYFNLFVITLIAGSFFLGSCSDDSTGGGGGTTVPTKTTLELIEESPNNAGFLEIIKKAEMESMFSGTTKLTLILPFDSDLQAAGISAFQMTKQDAIDLVHYHLIQGEMAMGDFPVNGYLSSMNTSGPEDYPLSIYSNSESGVVRLNGTQIEAAKLSTNGAIFPYAAVLRPPSMLDQLTNNPGLNNFKTLVTIESQAKDLYNGTSEFTAFATSNELVKAYADSKNVSITRLSPSDMRAFMHRGLIKIKAYHSSSLVSGSYESLAGDITLAVSGGTIKINNKATVIVKDIIATNGIMHIIDTALLP